MNRFSEVCCWLVFFAAMLGLGLCASRLFFNSSETSFAEMRNNTLQSQLAFKGGNFHLVQIPAGAFDIFFPGATLIVTEGHEPTGPDVYLMPDGWYFQNTTIENSPEVEINLKYLQTWTWSCEWGQSGSSYDSETGTHSDWEDRCGAGEHPWKKTRLAYTTKAEAVAARDEHNEKTGHDAWLGENMILKLVPHDEE